MEQKSKTLLAMMTAVGVSLGAGNSTKGEQPDDYKCQKDGHPRISENSYNNEQLVVDLSCADKDNPKQNNQGCRKNRSC